MDPATDATAAMRSALWGKWTEGGDIVEHGFTGRLFSDRGQINPAARLSTPHLHPRAPERPGR
jgi:hypothetical protein